MAIDDGKKVPEILKQRHSALQQDVDALLREVDKNPSLEFKVQALQGVKELLEGLEPEEEQRPEIAVIQEKVREPMIDFRKTALATLKEMEDSNNILNGLVVFNGILDKELTEDDFNDLVSMFFNGFYIKCDGQRWLFKGRKLSAQEMVPLKNVMDRIKERLLEKMDKTESRVKSLGAGMVFKFLKGAKMMGEFEELLMNISDIRRVKYSGKMPSVRELPDGTVFLDDLIMFHVYSDLGGHYAQEAFAIEEGDYQKFLKFLEIAKTIQGYREISRDEFVNGADPSQTLVYLSWSFDRVLTGDHGNALLTHFLKKMMNGEKTEQEVFQACLEIKKKENP
jgi:hypothetical protein